MKKKNKHQYILFSVSLSLFLACLTYGLCASAEPYFIDREIEVLTVYSNDPDNTTPKKEEWRIIPVETGNNSVTLEFCSKRKQNSAAICRVSIQRNHPQNTISWQGIGNSQQLSGEEGFLIIPGYPAPCDILPVSQKEKNKNYIIRNMVGGQIFVDQYEVSVDSISVETARQNGWIDSGKADPEKIVQVTVRNEKKETVLIQLWPVNGVWWIYEETPHRKSWALP
jgi:hypothetical protein